MAGRLPRIQLAAVAWLLLAVLLALLCGLLVGAAPAVALDACVIVVAAVAVMRYPLPALVVILVARAALPNSVLIGFVTLGAGALALVFAAPRLPAKRVVVPFFALLLIALASTPLLPSSDEGPAQAPLTLPVLGIQYADAPSTELLAWMNLASVLAVFCLAAWAVTTHARLRMLATAVLVSAIVPVGIGLQQLATGDTGTRTGSALESLRGPFINSNYFGFYLVVVIVVGLVVLLESRSLLVRTALTAFLGASLVCLFLTYTRAAWIGFAIALLVLALGHYRRLLAVAVVTTLLALLIAPVAADRAQERFDDITSESEADGPNSWRWRVDQWEALTPYGSERPLLGQGFGSYSRITVRHFGHFNRRFPTVKNKKLGVFSPVGFSAHNDYVKLFVEMGVPGVVLWVFVFAGVIGASVRARRVPGLEALGTAMVALTLALMLISISDNLQGYSVVLMYVFALCGGLAGVTVPERRRRVAASAVAQPVAVAEAAPPVAEPAAPAEEPAAPPVDEPPPPAEVPDTPPAEPEQPVAAEAGDRPPPSALTRVHARLARKLGRRSRFL